MKIFLATIGSRGDFEPFLAFAIGAKADGHDVVLACTTDFSERAQLAGIHTVVLPGSIHTLIQDSGVSATKAWKDFKTTIKPLMTQALEAAAMGIVEHEPDVVVYHPKVLTAPIAAAKIGASSVIVEIVPLVTPTTEFGAAGIGAGNFGIFNRATYALVGQSARVFGKEIRSVALRLGVAEKHQDYSVCLVSPSILKKPHDWPTTTHLVGQWVSKDSVENPNDELLGFVTKAPTILAGFGSMKLKDAGRRTDQVVAAIRDAGFQAALITGWGGLETRSFNGVMSVESADFAGIFPHLAGVVHHGGAGTVHTALRAGKPSVIVPFFADQPWWAARLHAEGLGPRGIPVSRFTTDKLQTAIQQLPDYQANVNHVHQLMKNEDGIQKTLELLPAFL